MTLSREFGVAIPTDVAGNERTRPLPLPHALACPLTFVPSHPRASAR